MKKFASILLASSAFLALFSSATPALASSDKTMQSLQAALEDGAAKSKLDSGIKLYFGKNAPAKVIEQLGNDTTSQKANGFGKAPDVACRRAFLSSMLQLQKRAKVLGANAIVNIRSNYNHVEFSSETEFECHVGALMVGTAFKADFVKVAPAN